MKKRSSLIFTLFCILLLESQVIAQNNCPSLPKKITFDTLGYIKAEIPTDPSRPIGIWLGQGIVNRSGQFRPGYIPSNKPSWAIATAVAWNYARNVVQRVEYPKIGYWMATLIQETELRCATGMTWSLATQVPTAYNPATVYAAQINNGCLQIEGPGSAYSALQQAYPYGRFPSANYSTLIEGVDGYEASALVKVYNDSYTSQIFNYNAGWDFYENVDCKRQYDAYAYEKMSASAYNGGPNAFLGVLSTLNNTGPGCWTGLPATTPGYANDIAKWISVFENNTSYCDYPAGSTWGGYYTNGIAWADVTNYLGIIDNMYPEINFLVDVIPEVQAAFIAKAGAIGNTIPFQEFGSVVDAIVLNLPLERPNMVEGNPIGASLSCSGSVLPFGHIEILDGSTTMCLGNSVTLELVIDAGGGPNPTYKWFSGTTSDAVIGTGRSITVTPTSTGVFNYAAQICNAAGCYTVYSNNQSPCQDPRNRNGFKVTVNNCSTCGFLASATSINTPCTGMNAGTINLSLVNAPANYRVTYTANTPLGAVSNSFVTSGSAVSIPNVRDGSYNIILESISTPTCKAYTNVIVNFTTAINEYVDATRIALSADQCTATVSAEIKELPAPCNWKVRTFVDVFFQWENWVNVGVVTSTGISTLDKFTRIAIKPELDLWNDVPISEQIFSLTTGDRIDIFTALTTTPGATQIRAYTTQIFNENDVLVHTIVSPAGSSNSAPFYAGGYTVTCPNPVPPTYTFSWTPSLSTIINMASQSNGSIVINFTTPTIYTVSAQHPTNPQCIVRDTLRIQPTCPTTLPVSLLSIEAVLQNETVDVYWSSASETDLSLFILERSVDGIHFSALGSVEPKNGSSYPRGYVFEDVNPLSTTTYYRLKMVNNDQSLEYSSVVSVSGLFNLGLGVYPNPFENNTTLKLEGFKAQINSSWSFSIMDLQGKLVETGSSHEAALLVGLNLSVGIYFVEVFYGQQVLNEKLIKY